MLLLSQLGDERKRLEELRAAIERGPKVAEALEWLSQEMFADVARVLEEHLTRGLQEVLDQPIRVRVETGYSSGKATVEFSIERNGYQEDIMKGQGGSVLNVLSVGLRMLALRTLPEESHRPFLVLDEPDAWLRPDVVPNLVRIVAEAGREMGFQTILISHHDVSRFVSFADKIYEFEPNPDGTVAVRLLGGPPELEDGELPTEAVVEEVPGALPLLFE